MPVDPVMLARGAEWAIGGLDGATEAGRAGALDGATEAGRAGAPAGTSFGDLMVKQISSLNELQTDAAAHSTALALGQAEDPSAAVLAVERARLSMQLAVNVRTKLTDALTEVLRTQV